MDLNAADGSPRGDNPTAVISMVSIGGFNSPVVQVGTENVQDMSEKRCRYTSHRTKPGEVENIKAVSLSLHWKPGMMVHVVKDKETAIRKESEGSVRW